MASRRRLIGIFMRIYPTILLPSFKIKLYEYHAYRVGFVSKFNVLDRHGACMLSLM
jgi:hypothetical protein